MNHRLADLEFEPWIEHVFSHAVPHQGEAWYFGLDADIWDGPAELTVRHLTRLFDNPVGPLEYFSDSQIAQGLYYVIDSGAGGLVLSLMDEDVRQDLRVRCLEAITNLFLNLLQPRVAPILGHLDEPGGRPLNMVTYMWWDIFPVAAKVATNKPVDPLNAAILGVMERTLQSKNPAIQESALHGLGHWARACPKDVARIVDGFLASTAGRSAEIVAYARSARQGCVL